MSQPVWPRPLLGLDHWPLPHPLQQGGAGAAALAPQMPLEFPQQRNAESGEEVNLRFTCGVPGTQLLLL